MFRPPSCDCRGARTALAQRARGSWSSLVGATSDYPPEHSSSQRRAIVSHRSMPSEAQSLVVSSPPREADSSMNSPSRPRRPRTLSSDDAMFRRCAQHLDTSTLRVGTRRPSFWNTSTAHSTTLAVVEPAARILGSVGRCASSHHALLRSSHLAVLRSREIVAVFP